MTRIRQIADLARQTVERYGTNNPFDLCEAMGIRLVLCSDFQKLKGMYKVILDQRFIFLNSHLHRREAREVLAHELGHDALHREMAEGSVVQDYFLMDMTLKPEYEANLFAAELLCPDEETRRLFLAGRSIEDAARLLKADPVFVRLKAEILREKGLLPPA